MEYGIEVFLTADEKERIDRIAEESEGKADEDICVFRESFEDGTVARLMFRPAQRGVRALYEMVLDNIGGVEGNVHFFDEQYQEDIYGYWTTEDDEWFEEEFGCEVVYWISIEAE